MYPDTFSKTMNIHKLRDIFTEAFEVAFLICNNLPMNFGIAKILDIVQQIIPTAFIMETSYWIFFSTLTGNDSLCVCHRFGITCKHTHSYWHWVNVYPLKEKFSFIVERERGIVGIPVNFNIEIFPVDQLKSIDVNITFAIQACNGHDMNNLLENASKLYMIRTKYSMVQENIPNMNRIIKFVPHPTSHLLYGSIFPMMLQRFICLSPDGIYRFSPNCHIVDSETTPRYTIALTFGSVEEVNYLSGFSNVTNYFTCGGIQMLDKETQTESDSNNEAERSVALLPSILNSELSLGQTDIFYNMISNEARLKNEPQRNAINDGASTSSQSDARSDNLWQYDPVIKKPEKKRMPAFSRLIASDERDTEDSNKKPITDKSEDKSHVSYASILKRDIKHNKK